VFHSFPMMDGRWVPLGFWDLQPGWLNVLDNKATVQFDHRVFASVTALLVLATAVMGLRAPLAPAARDGFLLMAGLVALQYLLGIVTVVAGSGGLGFVHELNAVLLLGAVIFARHSLRGGAVIAVYKGQIMSTESQHV